MPSANDIRRGMHIFGILGEYIGTVVRVEGGDIRLADCPFSEGGCHVPLGWVSEVGECVVLDRSRLEVIEELCAALAAPVLGAGAQ